MNPDSAVTSHIDMKIKSCQYQGVSLEKLMSVQQELGRTRQETEDVKELEQAQRSDHRSLLPGRQRVAEHRD